MTNYAQAERPSAGDIEAYQLSVERVLERFETSPTGLIGAAATTHRLQFGSNEIVTLKRESALRRYLRQFRDWMIVLLLASATVTAVLGDIGTAAVLVVLVAINTLIGFVQENRAEKTMEALETLVAPRAWPTVTTWPMPEPPSPPAKPSASWSRRVCTPSSARSRS